LHPSPSSNAATSLQLARALTSPATPAFLPLALHVAAHVGLHQLVLAGSTYSIHPVMWRFDSFLHVVPKRKTALRFLSRPFRIASTLTGAGIRIRACNPSSNNKYAKRFYVVNY
jgi:hypothetical protein